MSTIIRDFQRPVLDHAAWAKIGAATAHEAYGRRGAVDSSIKPVVAGLRVFGTAVTAIGQPGDNLTLHVALKLSKPGDVIVHDAGDYAEQGSFGDVMATSAKTQGVAGLVTNGGVRDAASIRELGLPVFSRSISIKGTVKETLGSVNVPIAFGGVIIHPGDLILGDDDGIVVIPAADIAAVLETSLKREEKEEKIRQEILSSGRSLWDVANFNAQLTRKGIALEL